MIKIVLFSIAVIITILSGSYIFHNELKEKPDSIHKNVYSIEILNRSLSKMSIIKKDHQKVLNYLENLEYNSKVDRETIGKLIKGSSVFFEDLPLIASKELWSKIINQQGLMKVRDNDNERFGVSQVISKSNDGLVAKIIIYQKEERGYQREYGLEQMNNLHIVTIQNFG